MTERDKTLETMTKIGSDMLCLNQDCGSCGCKCEYYDAATRLYCAGYRQVPQDSVILTPQEYSDYLLLHNDYNFAVENIDRLEGLLAKAQEKLIHFFKTRVEVQKETIEEILRFIEMEHYGKAMVTLIEDIKTKFLGCKHPMRVEVEE